MPKAPYIVYGIAAVATVNGKPYVDSQGDHIPLAELQKVARDFMSSGHGTGGVMHLRHPDGSVVEAGRIVASVVLSARLQKALGIPPLGFEPWVVGLEVTNPAVAQAIKSGALTGLSVAGRGVRTPFEFEE